MKTFERISIFILDTLYRGTMILLILLCVAGIIGALINVPELLLVVGVVFVLGLVGWLLGIGFD